MYRLGLGVDCPGAYLLGRFLNISKIPRLQEAFAYLHILLLPGIAVSPCAVRFAFVALTELVVPVRGIGQLDDRALYHDDGRRNVNGLQILVVGQFDTGPKKP